MPIHLVLYALLPVFVFALPVMFRYPRWNAGAIVQMLLLLGVTVAGLSGVLADETAAVLAYGGIVLFRVVPNQLRQPSSDPRRLRFTAAAMPLLEWGAPGQALAAYGRAWLAVIAGDEGAAIEFARAWGNRPDAGPMAHLLRMYALDLLRIVRRPELGQALMDGVVDDGSAHYLTAVLRVLRTDAEVGDWDQLFRRWQEVLAHPMGMMLHTPIGRQAVVELHALAGDSARLEQDLKRYGSDFEALPWLPDSWRARCAERQGDVETARACYRRSLALIARNDAIRPVLQERLERCGTGTETRPDADRYEALCAQLEGALMRTERARGFVLVPMQPVTAALILGCTVMWAVAEWLGGSENVGTLYRLGAMIRGDAAWRYVTAMFLHAGVLHLLFNMLGLAFFGSQVEVLFGRVRYLLLYFLAGAFANVAGAMDTDICVGASGAVLAALGAYAAACLMAGELMSRPMRRRLLAVLALMVAAQFGIDHTSTVINQMAHMAGVGFGLAFGVVLFPRARTSVLSPSPRPAGRVWRALIAIAFLIGSYAALQNRGAEQARARAEAALKAGHAEAARSAVVRSLDLNAEDPRAWFTLADVERADGNAAAYRRDIEHGLDLCPPIEPFTSMRRQWLHQR